VPPFDSLGMVSYSTPIATMAVSRTVSEMHRLIGKKIVQFSHPLVFGASVRGEAVGVEQRPSVTKNLNDEAIRR